MVIFKGYIEVYLSKMGVSGRTTELDSLTNALSKALGIHKMDNVIIIPICKSGIPIKALLS